MKLTFLMILQSNCNFLRKIPHPPKKNHLSIGHEKDRILPAKSSSLELLKTIFFA